MKRVFIENGEEEEEVLKYFVSTFLVILEPKDKNTSSGVDVCVCEKLQQSHDSHTLTFIFDFNREKHKY